MITEDEIALNAFLGEPVPASVVAEIGQESVKQLLKAYCDAFNLPRNSIGAPKPATEPFQNNH